MRRSTPAAPLAAADPVAAVVKKYWGYDTLRPLQAEAIRAGIERRDSLVMLPTGGGKSLCYQVPPVVADRTDVVVSPLISLMKDQVDGLRECGYSAAALHSGMSGAQRGEVLRAASNGEYRLLFVAPERLMLNGFQSILDKLDVRSFAIDEAHCISHWGHDFRPEYRQLAELRRRYPNAALQAFTATATERVRRDIISQLGLRNPAVLVGDFDRPNLTFRVVPRDDGHAQTLKIVRRHPNEAVIVYCISRKDTEAMAGFLKSNGINAEFYHAGMDSEDRQKTQEAFSAEDIDVIVATVAFGMGIDRSNVRCVIHAAMPKSIEHYQQEAGRAGRDGLEAECVMLYSSGDVVRWQKLLSPEDDSRPAAENYQAQIELLQHLQAYCQPFSCRHRRLVEYFGQSYSRASCDACDACDVCLKETGEFEDVTVLAQKVLSCVARTGERFGAKHISDVLRGGDTEMIRKWNHQNQSTYGLIRDRPGRELTATINQLADLGLLVRSTDGYATLSLNAASWEVMRGQRTVRVPQAPLPVAADDKRAEASWVGVDRGLFEELRHLRKQIADERGVPAFQIFNDASLRDMARRRPRTDTDFRRMHGVGGVKLAEFGARFVTRIGDYCVAHGLAANMTAVMPQGSARPPSRPGSGTAMKSHELFASGATIEEVMAALGRAQSTVTEYLAGYILETRPRSIEKWVDDESYRQVAAAARKHGSRPLKPIFDALKGTVPYDLIRLVAAHLEATASSHRF